MRFARTRCHSILFEPRREILPLSLCRQFYHGFTVIDSNGATLYIYSNRESSDELRQCYKD